MNALVHRHLAMRIARLSAAADALDIRLAKSDGESHTPPQGVQSAAARGLELRRKWKRGGLSNAQASSQGIGSGVQRATNLKNGDAISTSTLRMMRAFFSRHQKNYAPDKREADGGPTAGTIAWLLWGGNAGKAWSNSVLGRIEKSDVSDVHVPSAEWYSPKPAARRKRKRAVVSTY